MVRQLDPNGAECQELQKKIQRKKSKINEKICERKENKHNLPYYPPYANAPPRRSVQGHEDVIQDLKDHLQDDEKLYAAKCGGGSGDSSSTNNNSDNVAKTVNTITGLGVTYWIISEGLRVLFPPRNIIPLP